MRSRLTITALSLAVMAAGIIATPVTAQAADPKPSSDAVIRMETGTAYAKEIGERRYRITLPEEATIQWLGQATGGDVPPRGELSAKGLTRAWTDFGHQSRVGVPTRVTWDVAGRDYTDFRSGFVSQPRLNDAGRLVVTFETERGRLPKVLPDFTLNISPANEPARPQARTTTYPTQKTVEITGATNMGLQIVASALTTATMTFVIRDASGNWTPCSGVVAPVVTMASPTNQNYNFGPFPCSTITIEGGPPSYLGWKPGKAGVTSTSVLPCYRADVPTGTEGVSYCASVVTWG